MPRTSYLSTIAFLGGRFLSTFARLGCDSPAVELHGGEKLSHKTILLPENVPAFEMYHIRVKSELCLGY